MALIRRRAVKALLVEGNGGHFPCLSVRVRCTVECNLLLVGFVLVVHTDSNVLDLEESCNRVCHGLHLLLLEGTLPPEFGELAVELLQLYHEVTPLPLNLL